MLVKMAQEIRRKNMAPFPPMRLHVEGNLTSRGWLNKSYEKYFHSVDDGKDWQAKTHLHASDPAL